jgi:glutamate racemase
MSSICTAASAEPTPKPNQRIALFDSGVGGLTVLREVYRQLPNESVLYFADNARLPYGIRSQAEIVEFVREIMAWLETQDVKMVVMACNTSSALALEIIRAEFNLPILGLILPGARAAVKKGRRIGVIATPATAASNAYRYAIEEIDPTAQVWQVGCPEFVPIIENNEIDSPYTQEVAQQYLAPLLQHKVDTLIYGCTHYRHLEPVFQKILPTSVQIVDPAVSVVAATERELELLGLSNDQPPIETRFCVSGSIEQFSKIGKQWLGFSPEVEQIYLKKVSAVVE